MAEVFGTVVGAIAVAETAVKAGGIVAKLRSLWAEVKNVPDTIHDLMREIEILDLLILEMENELNVDAARLSHLLIDEKTAKLCTDYCRAAIQNLTSIVNELSVQIETPHRKSKVVTKLKVVLKKETLSRLHEKLHMAVRLLDSAKLSYVMTLTKLQTDIILMKSGAGGNSQSNTHILQRIDEGRGTEDNGEEFKRSRCTTRPLSIPCCWQRPFWGGITAVFSSSESQGEKVESSAQKQVCAARFLPPSWLSTKAWELRVNTALSGWQFNLKIYGFQPEGALVFQYAEKNDMVGLKRLFDAGLASPNDCDPFGRSIAYYASLGPRGNATVLQLLDWGVELDSISCIIIYLLIAEASRGRMKGAMCNDFSSSVFQTLISRGLLGIPVEFEDDEPKNQGICRCCILAGASFNSTIFRSLLNLYSPMHYKLPLRLRIRPLIHNLPFIWKPDGIRLLLQPDGVLQAADVTSLLDDGYAILHYVAWGYGEAVVSTQLEACEAYYPVEEWESLLSDIVPALSTSQICEDVGLLTANFYLWNVLDQYPPLTAFFCFLVAVGTNLPRHHHVKNFNRWIKMTSRSLYCWLESLHSVGVDLREYGERELAFFMEQGRDLRSYRWGIHTFWAVPHEFDGIKLVRFRYGPKPEDWTFEWDIDCEEFAGEFWDMTENPPLRIPGGWFTDNGD